MDLLNKLDDAIKYIRRLDTPEKKQQVYAIIMHPEDCFKVWNLLTIPQEPAVVTTYKGYAVVANDKIEEGTTTVVYKEADLPVDFAKPQYIMPIEGQIIDIGDK